MRKGKEDVQYRRVTENTDAVLWDHSLIFMTYLNAMNNLFCLLVPVA
jgi:hypothetical protein